ncbi:methionyl-tRNA formyltransferase [Agromyces sp. SYSU T00194]|uniref:methionyl-tRNA formyltransferase n=1 Tax=Agromyces chitinivorans TaxID=3158560 RepID=UPI0033934315
MRIVYAGTPAVAVPALEALAASGHDVVGVVTREDAPLGRRRVLTPSPVAAAAERLGIPVVKANRLDDDATARITAMDAELGVIVAYGGLVREPLLSAPRHGWVNLHFSLLPAWRGAAPVQRALMAGDRETGASVFRLVPALDAGDVLVERRTAIGDEETAGALLDRLATEQAGLVVEAADAIAAGTAVARPQAGEPTFAPKLGLADGRLDWSEPAVRVLDRYRGVTPEPGAHTEVDGARLKVLELAADAGDAEPLPPGRIALVGRRALVGTGTGPLRLVRVQPAGGKAMAAADWVRGRAGAEVVAR